MTISQSRVTSNARVYILSISGNLLICDLRWNQAVNDMYCTVRVNIDSETL